MADTITGSWQEAAEALTESSRLDSWNPEPGEAIAGEIIEVDRHAGRDNDSTLITLRTEAGERVPVWLNTVLEREFDHQQMGNGCVVALKYFGKRTSKAGREYKAYSAAVLERPADDDLPI